MIESVEERQSAVGSGQSDGGIASSRIASYRDLRVWELAIAANIAEGYGRDSRGSYLQFLRISQGSLKELETHAIVAMRLGLMQTADETSLLNDADDLGRMLRSLIRKLENGGGT